MAAITGRAGGLSARLTGDQEVGARMSGEGNFLSENLSGRWAERTYRGNVHFLARAAVTVPVNASTLVSVCGIYNPPGSGKVLEILYTDIGFALATTVVQSFVWVSSTVSASALATFTTAVTARNRRMQDPSSTVARVYSAVTHSGTPDVECHIGSTGATTFAGMALTREFNGSLIIPQGVLASIATLTAASTSSGINLGFAWADLPA